MKFKEKYFHTVAIACGVGFLLGVSGIAKAESYYQMATVESVQPMFKQITTRVPSQVCTEVDVPIYGQSGGHDKTGDILGGAIIGGIIGHQIGKGDARKHNRNVGAVIGGLIGSQQMPNTYGNVYQPGGVVSTQIQNRCFTTYTHQQETFITHYFVTVDVNGTLIRQKTGTRYNVGDAIEVYTNYRLR